MKPPGDPFGTPGVDGPNSSGSATIRSKLRVASTGMKYQLARRRRLTMRRGDGLDSIVLEQPLHLVAHLVAKDRQRRVLRRDQRDRRLRIHVIRSLRGHERQLVDRKRPRHPAGNNERELVDIPALDVLDQPVQLLVEPRVVDRLGVAQGGALGGAHREQQRVVLERFSAGGVHRSFGRVEPLEGVLLVLEADLASDVRQRILLRPAVGERLAHPHGPVDEVGLGGQDGGRDPVSGQVLQGECRLERRDATAGDHNAKSGFGGGGHARHTTNGISPRQPRRAELLLRKTT